MTLFQLEILKVTETRLLPFLEVTKQFIIPIYQRTYSWNEKQCNQLWEDIIRVSNDKNIPSHFIGSIVYIEEGLSTMTGIPKALVIDGQQRLTTLSLLLAALKKILENKGIDETKQQKIEQKYLFNHLESEEEKHKLILTKSDKDTLISILDERPLPESYSKNIKNNFEYFQNKILKSNIDLDILYNGIAKLSIVEIALDSNSDNPQLIFESLNSTGLDLSKADLIRNYILIGLDQEKQKEIYNDYWYKMEGYFRDSGDMEQFDSFMRDYLTIKTGKIPHIRDVYPSFKKYSLEFKESPEKLVSDIFEFSRLYSKLAFEREEDEKLQKIIHNINLLKVDVAYPFLLKVLSDHKNTLISDEERYEIFSIVESYVFRRAICEIPTHSLNKIFLSLLGEIKNDSYVESIKAFFNLKDSYRRFPDNQEFEREFCIKNVYNFRINKYLFEKLENHNIEKEYRYAGDYTIEHIMPQNENLSQSWKDELGADWKKIHDEYLHTIGNLTLTGYNSELGDKTFQEKRDMEGGFKHSPISLNSNLANLESWNELEIKKRALYLAKLASQIWEFPALESNILEKYKKESYEMDEDDEPESQITWDDKLQNASEEIRILINELILASKQKLGYYANPHQGKLALYIQESLEAKNRFALIKCGKNTSYISFRVDLDKFIENEKARQVSWFFKKGTERRINITREDIPQILEYMEHAYNATKSLKEKRHNAAIKAQNTRKDTNN